MIDGEHVGRLLWHDIWLTEDGAKYALRDLRKLGVESLDQLEKPLPAGIVIEANVVLRRDDDGTERNQLRNSNPFDLVGIEPEKPDPFAPAGPPTDGAASGGATDGDGFNWSSGEQGDGEAHP